MYKAVAILKQESPFFEVFPGGRAPILPLGPGQADLKGSNETAVYMLDIVRCESEQLERIAEITAGLRGGTKAEVMDFLMAERRMPIRKSQVERVEGDAIPLRMFV